MKKILLSIGLLLTVSMATVVFNSCGGDKDEPKNETPTDPTDPDNPTDPTDPVDPNDPSSTTDAGVIINGVKWATCNVNGVGTFAATPESAGKFYQWNRKKAWAATGDVSGWGTSSSTLNGTEWEISEEPSPAGWRVPVYNEFLKLLETQKVTNEWTIQNGVSGRKFTDKTTGASLFLPATGYRRYSDGKLDGAGTQGYYWGTIDNNYNDPYSLRFSNTDANVNLSNNYTGYISRVSGFSVRCVSDEVTISLDSASLALLFGKDYNYTLTATVLPDYAANQTITWTTSNAAIATVANGKVTVVDVGTAIITAKVGNKTATCTVTVRPPEVPAGGVWINGVIWATRNVDEVGTFAATPESYGKFYQWNRKKAWATTGDVSGWDTSDAPGTTWEKANDPSPAGWRVPTLAEINTLFDAQKVTSEWTTQNGVSGRKFTHKTTGATIFLPAAGYRSLSSSTLLSAGTYGRYWSSTPCSTYSYLLNFSSSYVYPGYNLNRALGFSVRCVAE
jgi:uncharacterized protein (TIGR02145 family)